MAGWKASYNSILNGTDGRGVWIFGFGFFTGAHREICNQWQYDCVSTIDVTLQSIVEKHIRAVQ
ncbi:MAG: hypothetical protein ACLTKE_07890 [Coprococcus sp.]